MNPCELTVGITALANAIACKLSDDDLSLIASAVTQLGDTLSTISASRAYISSRCAVSQKADTAPAASDKSSVESGSSETG